MNSINLYEAYSAVYNEELRDEILHVEEDFSFIDELSDNELDQVMEEILSEGVELSECFEVLDDVLIEATVTSSEDRGESGKSRVTTGQGSVMAAKQRVAARKSQRRAERVERIKSSAKRASEKIKSTASDVASKIKGKTKEGAKKVSGKLASAKGKIKGFLGRVGRAAKAGYSAAKAEFKNKPEKREPESRAPRGSYRGAGVGRKERAGGEIREPKKSVSEPNKERIARAKSKLERAARGTTGQGVRFATSSGQVSQRMKSGSGSSEERQKASKRFAKKVGLSDHYEYLLDVIFEDMILEGYVGDYETAGIVLESLSDSDFDYVMESYNLYLTEDVEEREDLYDVVLDHLLDEGYVDDVESAMVIMANMSEEWRDQILEAKVDKVVDRQLKKSGVDPVTRMQTKMGARKSRKPGLTPRTGRQWKLSQKLSDMKDRQTEYPLRGSRRGAESPAD